MHFFFFLSRLLLVLSPSHFHPTNGSQKHSRQNSLLPVLLAMPDIEGEMVSIQLVMLILCRVNWPPTYLVGKCVYSVGNAFTL
jgi:hypothetical protein